MQCTKGNGVTTHCCKLEVKLEVAVSQLQKYLGKEKKIKFWERILLSHCRV